MGGNALEAGSVRLNAKEYHELTAEVLEILKGTGVLDRVGYKFKAIKAYEDKADFGDLDILWTVTGPDLVSGVTMREIVEARFMPNEIVRNGPVLSFDYKGFQIDLIYSAPEDFSFAFNYYSWNDLGNFIGRTAHRLGFKFGHEGLIYVLRDPEDDVRVIDEILVTNDWESAMHFLGFEIMPKSFKTPEEIFEYAASSMYFDPATFVFGNRNHTARVRDRKRKMYNMALAYYKEKYGITDESVPVPLDKVAFRDVALETFPKFRARRSVAMIEHLKRKAFKLRVNGDVVARITCTEGKELGAMMKKINQYLSEADLTDWIISLDVDVAARILETIFEDVL